MIAGWIAYCLIVSMLVGVAAAGADAFLTRRRRSARAVWMLGIVASLAIPATTFVLQQRVPAPIEGAAEARFSDIFARVRARELAAAPEHHATLLERVPRVRTPQWLAADGFATTAIVMYCRFR